MVGHLKEIDIGELSLTKGLGANKKKYAFIKNDKPIDPKCIVKIIKADLAITIKSDGTAKGTKIRVNGRKIEGLKDFTFSLYDYGEEKIEAGFGPGAVSTTEDKGYINCSYTLKGKERNGFKVSNTYYLMKSDMEVKEEMVTSEVLKQYFGKDVELKKEDAEAIEKSLEIINEYKESFPEELKDSVGVIMKTALLEAEPKSSEESEDEPEEKTDVGEEESEEEEEEGGDKITKLSDDKISKIVKKVVKELESKKSGKKVEKKEVVGKEVEKKLKEMKETIAKKDGEVEKLEERLEKVEKVKGIKKSIDGQEEGEGEVKKGGKWGSFFKK